MQAVLQLWGAAHPSQGSPGAQSTCCPHSRPSAWPSLLVFARRVCPTFQRRHSEVHQTPHGAPYPDHTQCRQSPCPTRPASPYFERCEAGLVLDQRPHQGDWVTCTAQSLSAFFPMGSDWTRLMCTALDREPFMVSKPQRLVPLSVVYGVRTPVAPWGLQQHKEVHHLGQLAEPSRAHRGLARISDACMTAHSARMEGNMQNLHMCTPPSRLALISSTRAQSHCSMLCWVCHACETMCMLGTAHRISKMSTSILNMKMSNTLQDAHPVSGYHLHPRAGLRGKLRPARLVHSASGGASHIWRWHLARWVQPSWGLLH